MFNKLFDQENPVMQTLSNVFDLAVLNILLLVFSLPLFTIGASITAVSDACFRMIQDKTTGVLKSFWKSFKLSFKPATQIWLLMLAVTAFLGFDLWYFLMMQNFISGILQAVICGIFILLLLNTLLITTYAIHLTALFENTVPQTLRNAVLFTLRNPIRNVAILAVDAFMIWLAFFFPVPITFVTVAVIFLGFSFAIFLNCWILFPVFKPFLPNEEPLEN